VIRLVGTLLGLAYPSPPQSDYGAPFQESSHTARMLLAVEFADYGVFHHDPTRSPAPWSASALSRTIDWTSFLSTFGSFHLRRHFKVLSSLYLSGEGDTTTAPTNPPVQFQWISDEHQELTVFACRTKRASPAVACKAIQGCGATTTWEPAVPVSRPRFMAYDFAMDQDEEDSGRRAPAPWWTTFDWVTDDNALLKHTP